MFLYYIWDIDKLLTNQIAEIVAGILLSPKQSRSAKVKSSSANITKNIYVDKQQKIIAEQTNSIKIH